MSPILLIRYYQVSIVSYSWTCYLTVRHLTCLSIHNVELEPPMVLNKSCTLLTSWNATIMRMQKMNDITNGLTWKLFCIHIWIYSPFLLKKHLLIVLELFCYYVMFYHMGPRDCTEFSPRNTITIYIDETKEGAQES